MPACRLPGEHARVNLQMAAGTSACNIPHQPDGTHFDQGS